MKKRLRPSPIIAQAEKLKLAEGHLSSAQMGDMVDVEWEAQGSADFPPKAARQSIGRRLASRRHKGRKRLKERGFTEAT